MLGNLSGNYTCLQSSYLAGYYHIYLVMRLKESKADGGSGLTTDCLIYGTQRLFTCLSLLFRCMLTHGVVPSEFLLGTMSPIPKSLANSNCSDKYRAITLSSIIGRLLDLLILEREGYLSLSISHLQLGFKN